MTGLKWLVEYRNHAWSAVCPPAATPASMSPAQTITPTKPIFFLDQTATFAIIPAPVTFYHLAPCIERPLNPNP